ncbi:hypothetical protein RRG08_044414 [Elysia crispata]|uniref:Uncharacterized protein n=1 Tax=Elysia crispata TaxID=231223 RepID=A0AAE0ZUZ5_9GAST|nr:hypothetical protein RRG08_044414 [Elysia crispata]
MPNLNEHSHNSSANSIAFNSLVLLSARTIECKEKLSDNGFIEPTALHQFGTLSLSSAMWNGDLFAVRITLSLTRGLSWLIMSSRGGALVKPRSSRQSATVLCLLCGTEL